MNRINKCEMQPTHFQNLEIKTCKYEPAGSNITKHHKIRNITNP